MQYTHRDATESDLRRIVEIYNFAVATRKCSCDLEPTSVEARRSSVLEHAPALGIETLTATVFASNDSSIALFNKMGFERWGFMPRVARLEGVEKDHVLVGRRLHASLGAAQPPA